MEAQVYALKPITFLRRRVHILMQNENGPCPLLSLCNVLLLRNQFDLPADCIANQSISAEQLIHRFAEKLLDANSSHSADPNARKLIHDAIALLPRLNQGLDVNVRFCSGEGVLGFEYTAEFALFDLLDVTLAHGWLVDPQDQQAAKVLDGMTYNHAVECLVAFQAYQSPRATSLRASSVGSPMAAASSPSAAAQEPGHDLDAGPADLAAAEEPAPPPYSAAVGIVSTPQEGEAASQGPAEEEEVEEERPVIAAVTPQAPAQEQSSTVADGMVVDAFFRDSASQLTYHGLLKLHEHLSERQLCVFFRNNHFSTMFKIDGRLFLLVTDVGYLKESTVVWEKLDKTDGDTEYVTSDFGPLPTTTGDEMSIDSDYLLALQMQAGGQVPSRPHLPGGQVGPAQPSQFMPAQALPAAQATLANPGATPREVIPAAAVLPVGGVQPTGPPPPALAPTAMTSADDEALARQLQASFDQQSRTAPLPPPSHLPSTVPLTDEQLALQMQRELDMEGVRQWQAVTEQQQRLDAATGQRQSRPPTSESGQRRRSSGGSSANGSGCSIC